MDNVAREWVGLMPLWLQAAPFFRDNDNSKEDGVAGGHFILDLPPSISHTSCLRPIPTPT